MPLKYHKLKVGL